MESAVAGAADEAHAVVKLLSEGQSPGRELCASLVVSSAEAVVAMAQRVSTLDRKLEELGSEVKQIGQQVAELQLQVYGSSDAQLFCELAMQTVSKVVRKATGCTAWDARRTPLQAIKAGPGAAVYRSVVQQYPLLKAAVEAACSQGRPLDQAAPMLHVTEQSLRALIQRAAAGPVRPAAEQLLACLVALATEFNEPLFMAAAPPS